MLTQNIDLQKLYVNTPWKLPLVPGSSPGQALSSPLILPVLRSFSVGGSSILMRIEGQAYRRMQDYPHSHKPFHIEICLFF